MKVRKLPVLVFRKMATGWYLCVVVIMEPITMAAYPLTLRIKQRLSKFRLLLFPMQAAIQNIYLKVMLPLYRPTVKQLLLSEEAKYTQHQLMDQLQRNYYSLRAAMRVHWNGAPMGFLCFLLLIE